VLQHNKQSTRNAGNAILQTSIPPQNWAHQTQFVRQELYSKWRPEVQTVCLLQRLYDVTTDDVRAVLLAQKYLFTV
jgi:hypothetical protein